MVREDKTAVMTKLSAFEQTHEREIEMKTKYKRRDYVSVKLFQAFLMSSIAYLITAAAIVYMQNETGGASFKVETAAAWVFACYFLYLIVMLVIVYFYARKRYDAISKTAEDYRKKLKELERLYDKEGEEKIDDNIGT